MAILIYGSGGGSGTDISDTTAQRQDVLPGKYFYLADGTRVEGSMATKAAATIIPSTTNQTINANQYLSGAQTIQGSANLKAENIKSGVNIFGITGNLDKTNISTGWTLKYPSSNRLTISSSDLSGLDMLKVRGIIIHVDQIISYDTGDILMCYNLNGSSELSTNDTMYGIYRDNNSNTEVGLANVAKIYSISSSSISIAALSGFAFVSGRYYTILPLVVA